MADHDDYLLLTSAGWVGVWVRLVNNVTAVAYVSTAATDGAGRYRISPRPPIGLYTAYTGPTGTGGWTPTGDANYAVGDPVSTKPQVSDAVFYASQNGNDANDGLSWGSAKLTVAAAAALLPTAGGAVQLGAGNFVSGSALTVSGRGVRLTGVGGLTPGAAPATIITYSGTGARFIDARGSAAFELDHIGVGYSNAAFTGTLVDASPATGPAYSNLLNIHDAVLGGGALTSAAIIVDLDQINYATIERCLIGGGAVGVRGIGGAGLAFSNVVRLRDVNFSSTGSSYQLTSCAIQNPGQAWEVDGCNFEPLASGAPGALRSESAVNSLGQGVTFRGCWLGDVTAAGTWFNVIGSIGGLTIEGCYISGIVGSTVGITLPPVFEQSGLTVRGNSFSNLLTGIAWGAGADNVMVAGNTYSGVTNLSTGGGATIKSGLVGGLFGASITAASAGINSTETQVVGLALPANSVSAGTTYRIMASGVCTSSAANVGHFRARIGTTTLTGNIAVDVSPTAAASGTAIPFSVDILVTVRTSGASGAVIGSGNLANNGATGVSAAATAVAQSTATVALDTTANKILELTFQAAAATTTCTFHDAAITPIVN